MKLPKKMLFYAKKSLSRLAGLAAVAICLFPLIGLPLAGIVAKELVMCSEILMNPYQ